MWTSDDAEALGAAHEVDDHDDEKDDDQYANECHAKTIPVLRARGRDAKRHGTHGAVREEAADEFRAPHRVRMAAG